jgi:hypothetical protein
LRTELHDPTGPAEIRREVEGPDSLTAIATLEGAKASVRRKLEIGDLNKPLLSMISIVSSRQDKISYSCRRFVFRLDGVTTRFSASETADDRS